MLERRCWGHEIPIFVAPEKVSFRDETPVLITMDYISSLSPACDFPELPTTDDTGEWRMQIATHFKQQFKEMFVVPRLNKFHQTQNRINKSHLLHAFLSFLLQLLYHRRDPAVNPFQDWMDYLEKELRFLLTVLGDISWMLCVDAKFQDLLSEFEAVGNQAGSIVYYLFSEPAIEKTEEGIASFRNQTKLLKANLLSYVSIPAGYTTPMTSVIDSILILDSLVDDLEDLLKREDDPIADVKAQVKLLHQELLLSHSSIKDMTSPRPSEIEELKEPLTCTGGIAHQAEYLIASFLVEDAPLWYVINRLTHLSHMFQPIRTELQLITQKYQFGRGLKEAENFSAKLPLHDTEDNDVVGGKLNK